MTTVVDVQVHTLDFDDELTLEGLASIPNASFGRQDGIPMMTVYIDDGQDVVDTVIQAVRTLANKVSGATAVRVHPDLVNVTDISDRVGVSRQAVQKWIQGQRAPFPHPVGSVGNDVRVWRWVDVVAWLLAAKGIDMDEDLPSTDDIAHIDACISKVPDRTTQAWSTLSVQPAQVTELSVRHNPSQVVHPSVEPHVRRLQRV